MYFFWLDGPNFDRRQEVSLFFFREYPHSNEGTQNHSVPQLDNADTKGIRSPFAFPIIIIFFAPILFPNRWLFF
jgi:hypothetical protein